MKINRISGKSFENLGTIFAYKRRKFYPTIPEIQPTIKDIEDIIKGATVKKGEELIYIPSTQVSDLSEQALYNFEFNVTEDKKYIPNFYPGILDNYSQEILDSDLDIISPYIVPQISPSEDKIKFSYFGGFQDSEGNIIKLLKVPAGIWKLEIYNESRITSNIFYNNDNNIIEYNISSNFIPDIEPNYVPCLEIYLGPLYNTRLDGLNYKNAMENIVYKSRYLYNSDSSIESELEKCYDEYEYSMSETDYVKNYYQEVLSEKIICIAYSSNKKVISVNLIESSFNNLKNPWRNQNKVSMRTDDYLSHNFSPLESKFNFVFDKSSGIILGTEKQEFPIFEFLKSNYSPSLRSPEIKEIKLDNKTYVNGNKERLFRNPIISPDWILKRDLDTNYKNCYITSEEGGKQYFINSSEDKPIGGQILFKKGDKIKIKQECQEGYEFNGIETIPNVEYDELENGYYEFNEIPERILFKYSEYVYKLIIKFSCEDDYDYDIGEPCYTEFESRSTEKLIESDISIKIKNDSGIFEDYNYDNLNIDKTGDIVLKILFGADSKYEFKDQLGDPITIKIPDQVDKSNDVNNSAYIYPINLKTFMPEITIINEDNIVDLEKQRIICNYGGTANINFFSEDEDFKTKEEALKHISIQGKYKELNYFSNRLNYYTLRLSGIVSKEMEINIID